MIKEAMLTGSLENGKVACHLCAHLCKIPETKFGICRVRQNQNGMLYTYAYGKVIAAHVDPIEKKPLFHFLPGSASFSLATRGCNFRCPFCQNWQISQISEMGKEEAGEQKLSPREAVEAAQKSGCRSIAYTYTEPTIFFEYAFDTARLARDAGLANVFVSNGYMTREALETIQPYLDACNVDLKSFRDSFYRKVCGASLQPVLDSIANMKKMGIWVEVTTLVVPGENDDENELRDIARFISRTDKNIPWHISRFFPDYQYSKTEATPLETLRKARKLGEAEGLHHIYMGNTLGETMDTVCPSCKKTVIHRGGNRFPQTWLDGASCAFCGKPIAGIFNK